MKVCYVLPHFYPHVGGAEQAFLDVISALVSKKIDVRVITSSSGGGVGHKIYNGIDIYYYDWKMLCGHPIVRKRDLEEHVQWADIVHSAVYSPVFPTSSVCRKFGKPHVCEVYEVLGNKWFWIEKNKIKAFMFKLYEYFTVHKKVQLFFSDSLATKKDLMKCNRKAKVKNIYWISENSKRNIVTNVDDFKKFFNLNDNDKVFLNYGRPGKTKGLFVYLDAIKMVVNELDSEKLKNIKFCFIMASDPKVERKKFLNKVKKYGLSQYVIVKESVSRDDLNNYRQCADYVVVPSITEGFGLSAIEACEAGKKVIHSSAGSLPEVTFGEVVEFENRNSADLAHKLCGIILGNVKFDKKEKKDFSSETIANEFISTYEEVLDKFYCE